MSGATEMAFVACGTASVETTRAEAPATSVRASPPKIACTMAQIGGGNPRKPSSRAAAVKVRPDDAMSSISTG